MARIDFHPEAAKAIDARGDGLLSRVGSLAPMTQRRKFASHRVSPFLITEDQTVGRITMEVGNEYKKEVTEIRFEGLEGAAGLDRDSAQELDKVGQLAHKYLTSRSVVSERFVRAGVIEWVQQRFRQEISEGLSTFLAAKLSNVVARRTILVPIANLFLETDLLFGPVHFRVITSALMDSWYEWYRSGCPSDQLSSLEVSFDRRRKDIQGLTAASITVEADEDYAVEQCLEKAEQAVALLRVLHPANSSPYTALSIRPLGSEATETYSAYCYKEGWLRAVIEGPRWPFRTAWEIPREGHEEKLLKHLAMLFSTENSKRSDFQQRLFESLLIYSRNNLACEPYEKLIFCLVAIESMLLRGSEPIQDSIAERMAYLLGHSPEERLEIEMLVKRVYDIRSKFVHHGQRPTDLDVLSRFMTKAWVLFFSFISDMSAYKSKEAMLDELKRRKYR